MPSKPTKTRSRVKIDPFQKPADQPIVPAKPADPDPLDNIRKNAGVKDIRRASAATTRQRTAGIAPTADMVNMLSRMKDIDIDPDLAPYPEPEPPEILPSTQVNTQNLPAIAGQALQAAGLQDPEFHQVAQLPGNMAAQIRQLGKTLFGSMTATPTDKIYMIGNVAGQGPNTTAEVQAVAAYLKNSGQDLGPGDIDFDQIMPGYQAQTYLFSADGIRWLLVKDFAGQYIYAWPEADSRDMSAQKRLKEANDDMFANTDRVSSAHQALVRKQNLAILKQHPQQANDLEMLRRLQQAAEPFLEQFKLFNRYYEGWGSGDNESTLSNLKRRLFKDMPETIKGKYRQDDWNKSPDTKRTYRVKKLK